MDEFLRLRATVELARVGRLHHHHAGPLDALIARVERNRDVVADRDVRDEAATLLHAQQRLLALLPLGHGDASAEDARIHAHVGQRLGEREGAAPRLAGRVTGRAERHVFLLLLGRPQLGDRPQREIVHERRGRGPVVNPGRFVGDERKRQVVRTFEETAILGVQRRRRHAGAVERIEERLLLGRPLVREALTVRHKLRHDGPRRLARAGDSHLDIVPLREAPHDLAHLVAGQHFHHRPFNLILFHVI